MITPMIIQPFAENAIWHGLANKEERHTKTNIPKTVDSLFLYSGRYWRRKAKVAEFKKHSKTKRESKGIKITEARLSQLSHNKRLTGYKIIDLFDENDEGWIGE